MNPPKATAFLLLLLTTCCVTPACSKKEPEAFDGTVILKSVDLDEEIGKCLGRKIRGGTTKRSREGEKFNVSYKAEIDIEGMGQSEFIEKLHGRILRLIQDNGMGRPRKLPEFTSHPKTPNNFNVEQVYKSGRADGYISISTTENPPGTVLIHVFISEQERRE